MQDPISSRVLCRIKIGSPMLLVYERSKRNVRTYSTQHTLRYNNIHCDIYQLNSRVPIFLQIRLILDPVYLQNKKSVDILAI